MAYVDETGAPTGNADGNNPSGKRGWQWVMVTAVVTVFIQGLSRSTAAAIELLGSSFGGIVVYGPRLSALVGLLGSAFPLSFSKTQALLNQLLGMEISRGAIAAIRERISATLEQPMQEALALPVSSRWPTWMKPAPPPATPTATIPVANGAGSGSWSPLW